MMVIAVALSAAKARHTLGLLWVLVKLVVSLFFIFYGQHR
jgi:hypothetical protein